MLELGFSEEFPIFLQKAICNHLKFNRVYSRKWICIFPTEYMHISLGIYAYFPTEIAISFKANMHIYFTQYFVRFY